MTDWSRWLGEEAKTSREPELVRAFQVTEPVVDGERARVEGDAWRIDVEAEPFLARLFHKGQSVALFEVADPGRALCLLVYRAEMRSEGLKGRAYLEMWCRFPGRGEFFSKSFGVGQVVEGTSDWATYETPFILHQGERPDLVRLKVAIEGPGTVWIKEIELVAIPLEAAPAG